MADNVSINQGSSTTIATDDVGSVHYQRVKLTWGADGTATDVSTAAYLPVDGGKNFVVQVTPTVSSAAYADGDTLASAMVVVDAARVNSGTGMLSYITMAADTTTATAGSVDVFILNAPTTGSTITENSTLGIVDGDAGKIIGAVNLDEAFITGGGKVLTAKNINMPFVSDSSGDIHAIAATHGTWTFGTTSGAVFTFGVIRD